MRGAVIKALLTLLAIAALVGCRATEKSVEHEELHLNEVKEQAVSQVVERIDSLIGSLVVNIDSPVVILPDSSGSFQARKIEISVAGSGVAKVSSNAEVSTEGALVADLNVNRKDDREIKGAGFGFIEIVTGLIIVVVIVVVVRRILG